MRKTILVTASRVGSQPFNCHIIGHPDAQPVLYAGGVVYAEMLANLATVYGIKCIYAEFPYWHGRKITDMGYTSVKDITLDSMLADLQDVIAHCVKAGHISCSEDNYSYAVAGGSQPGWLAIALKNLDPHCIGLNLFATPVPGVKPEKWEKEKHAYLKANDFRSLSEQKLPLNSLLLRKKPGKRETLLAAESKAVIPGETLIEGYRRTYNPLFWQTPRCDDRIFWQGAAVSKDFFERFFEIIFTADNSLFRPTGEVLIIAGIHDFTIPYKAWIDFFNYNGAKLIHDKKYGMLFRYQGSQVRIVCSLGGHLPHVLKKVVEPTETPEGLISSFSSFTPDPMLVAAYTDWVIELKKLTEANHLAGVNLLASL